MEATYQVLNYNIYKAPETPRENGTYVSSTPVLEQALTAVENAYKRGETYFIKGVCSDGKERYYN